MQTYEPKHVNLYRVSSTSIVKTMNTPPPSHLPSVRTRAAVRTEVRPFNEEIHCTGPTGGDARRATLRAREGAGKQHLWGWASGLREPRPGAVNAWVVGGSARATGLLRARRRGHRRHARTEARPSLCHQSGAQAAGDSFQLDMATTVVPVGKVEVMHRSGHVDAGCGRSWRVHVGANLAGSGSGSLLMLVLLLLGRIGQRIPAGWAVDRSGRDTTDPAEERDHARSREIAICIVVTDRSLHDCTMHGRDRRVELAFLMSAAGGFITSRSGHRSRWSVAQQLFSNPQKG